MNKIKIFSRESRLFLDWLPNGIAEVFGTPSGRFFCPQLIFSDFGSPWLQFIEDRYGITTKILVSDNGRGELRRIN
jgi:hypothetical protein